MSRISWMIQLGIFGRMLVGSGIIAEVRYGTVERMRVTPASRLGLLLGRVLRDTLVLLIQATLLTLIAVAFGLRVPASGALITVASSACSASRCRPCSCPESSCRCRSRRGGCSGSPR